MRRAAVGAHRADFGFAAVAVGGVSQKPSVGRPGRILIARAGFRDDMIIFTGRINHVHIVSPLTALTLVGDPIAFGRPGRSVGPLTIRQTLEVGARRIHHIDFGSPGAVRNKNDLLPIRRKTRTGIDARRIGQPANNTCRCAEPNRVPDRRRVTS